MVIKPGKSTYQNTCQRPVLDSNRINLLEYCTQVHDSSTDDKLSFLYVEFFQKHSKLIGYNPTVRLSLREIFGQEYVYLD